MGGWDNPQNRNIKFNDSGIPVKVNDKGVDGYSPVDIGNYALWNFNKCYDSFLDKYQSTFLLQADWFVDNISNDGSWQYQYDNLRYNLRAPWIGAISQGLGISTLVRAFETTKKMKYLNIAKKAHQPFTKSIENGGVKFEDDDGFVWYEEYAVLPAPHILNGFIFALFGLFDLLVVTERHGLLLKSFDNGLTTISNNLYRYDLGYWSLYNLVHEHPATYHYHQVHVQQLHEIYRLTGDKIVGEYAFKWGKYLDSNFCKIKAKIMRNVVHMKRRML